MPTLSVRYPPPPFTHLQQANEANPQPPDPTTIQQPHGSMPPNWVHPRDPATTSVARWPFANRYIFKLILEMFQWGTKFEKDLRENHVFDTDTNMQAYFRRYFANEKNMKEDWFAMNLLLFKTIVNLMRHFRAEAANHTVAPVMQEVEDLNAGLSDTIKAVAEELEIKPAILKKAIKIAQKSKFTDTNADHEELTDILETVGRTL